MIREKIKKRLGRQLNMDEFIRAVQKKAKKRPKNYLLQVLNATLKDSADAYNNWFTALGAICIFQRDLADTILQEALILTGKPKRKKKVKEGLIDAISIGACLGPKMDAG